LGQGQLGCGIAGEGLAVDKHLVGLRVNLDLNEFMLTKQRNNSGVVPRTLGRVALSFMWALVRLRQPLTASTRFASSYSDTLPWSQSQSQR
jgi:hypothetical protein